MVSNDIIVSRFPCNETKCTTLMVYYITFLKLAFWAACVHRPETEEPANEKNQEMDEMFSSTSIAGNALVFIVLHSV